MATPRYPSAGPEPGYPAALSAPLYERRPEDFSLGVDAADRIDPAPGHRRNDGAIAVAVAALIVIGAGMALLDDRVRAPEPIKPPPAESNALSRPADELPVSRVPSVADAGIPRPEEPVQPEQAEARATELDTGPPEPLQPPTVDKDDLYQVKALAAGLHPGLSRTLLMRLTPEDYANAGLAVRKALTESKDGDVLIWPKQPAAGLAQFRVHFVRGAPDCRRYVVAVSLDRWATTALPMEKCGARLVEPKAR